jgi:hypothetical protein
MRSHNSIPKHVIILVHGIRDFALWQTNVRSALVEAGFTVEATNYGRFNLLQFLAPFPYFRRKAIDKVWNQIQIIQQHYPLAHLSVIAHSFGTFVIAQLMREKFNIKFHRVIFCGSVVTYSFPFEHFQDRFTSPLLNEVGTRDIWPAIAESVTIGYGSAGTYGFHRPLVRDRWHNGAHHGFFLDAEFCKQFWSPFLQDGTLSEGANKPEPPVFWLQLLSIVKLKILLFPLLLFFVGYLSYENSRPLLDRLYGEAISVPNPLTIGTKEELDSALKKIEQRKERLSPYDIKQISSELTANLISSSNQVIPRTTRRFMNEYIVRTLVFLNDRDLSFIWRTLPADTDLSYLDLSNIDLRGVNFKRTFFFYTNFEHSVLDDAIFDKSLVRNVDFKNAALSNVNFARTDWFNALNLPEGWKNGWPESYTEWMECPGKYKAADRKAFVNRFEDFYIIKFHDLKDEDAQDLRNSWDLYSKDSGLCDHVAGKS